MVDRKPKVLRGGALPPPLAPTRDTLRGGPSRMLLAEHLSRNRARLRPGHHGAPADLEHRPPRIVPAFLGWEDPGAAFTAGTLLGTKTEILVFFRTDIPHGDGLGSGPAQLRDPGHARLPPRLVHHRRQNLIGVFIGIAKACALIPGVSHAVAMLRRRVERPPRRSNRDATLIVFVVGYASIAFLLTFLSTHSRRVLGIRDATTRNVTPWSTMEADVATRTTACT